MKVLIVEDNEASSYLLQTLLTAYSHEVTAVPNGQAALAVIERIRFDLIISDIMMPEMDGFAFCYAIKNNPVHASMPFIFYSASYTQPNDIRFALSLGADRFLLKPMAPEQLIAEIDAVMVAGAQGGKTQQPLSEHEFLIGYAERMGQKLYTIHQRLSQATEQLTHTQNELNNARRMLGLLVDHSADVALIVNRQGQLLTTTMGLQHWLQDIKLPTNLTELAPPAIYQKILRLSEDCSSVPHDFHEVVTIGSAQVFITAVAVQYQQQPALLLLLRNLQGYAVLAHPQAMNQYVLKNLTEAVVLSDADNHIIAVNPTFSRITGYSEQESLGKMPRFLSPTDCDNALNDQIWTALSTEDQWQGEVRNRRKNGELYPEWLFLSVVRDVTGKIVFYIAIFSDISAHEEARRDIEHLAHHDVLTDLPNRTLVKYRLNEALAQAKAEVSKVALLFIDINRFNTVNDAFGQQAGDDLIKMIAVKLHSLIRPGDTVGRQGSDEFSVILKGIVDTATTQAIVKKILAALTTFTLGENTKIHLTSSIGIAVFPEDGPDEASLSKNASAALSKAKTEGGNNFQFYYAELNQTAERRRILEDALYNAIAKNELRLVYQPQYRLSDSKLVGCEVLARWRHPGLGDISPTVFIPLAEETGQINPIGDWILAAACRQAAAWLGADLTAITFAVNLSAMQFRRADFIQMVEQTLIQSGLPPQHLELELTEGILMHQTQTLIQTLNRFKKIGIELSIDDFGTGYSNLAYLNRFTVDKLKIDQSFVRGLPKNDNDCAIVKAIIQMAHSLGLTVIAEGVETEAQRDLLSSKHCNHGQGYLLSRPLEAGQFEALLKNEKNACNSMAK